MKELNETDKMQSSYSNPIEIKTDTETKKLQKPADISEQANLNILNIGQLLFLAFLFMMLLVQSINIYNSTGTADITNISNQHSNIVDMGNKTDVPYDTGGENAASNTNSNAANNAGIIFILGEHDGKLAILSPDRKILHEVFELYIDTLPEYDKKLLYTGIEINSTEELNSLIEDYNS